ncbi:hypothetical protein ANACAC_02133 [Anaerostipes caccae L1-92]|uniref:Uncharacterized protein n=1 Tax=Anaerostipes caccae (strain DSM 14662 / CCUG 47493 / JCM 13470 / NCIMB 13811 / L1-92) TaxID=411490 RepID=B0MFN4_ANACD|nr:hypothetical protein ANACAC_02133 [Anaerostipes caccae L1-92]
MARKKSSVTEGIPFTVAIISIFIWYLFFFLFSGQVFLEHKKLSNDIFSTIGSAHFKA